MHKKCTNVTARNIKQSPIVKIDYFRRLYYNPTDGTLFKIMDLTSAL